MLYFKQMGTLVISVALRKQLMKLRFFFFLTVLWLMLINGQAYAEALSPAEITALAERGDPAAQYELGRMYQGGGE